jgi:chaperonin GroES
METIKSLIPFGNRCLIQRIIPPALTKAGIILSQKVIEREARLGKVIAVGPGEFNDNGKFIKSIIKKGDIVLLPDFSGTKVDMEDKQHEYQLFRDSEILGIVKQYKL